MPCDGSEASLESEQNFICVTNEGAKAILMIKDSKGSFSLPLSKVFHNPVQSLSFRFDLHDYLGIKGHSHLIDKKEFMEYEKGGGPSVSLCVLQISSKSCLFNENMIWMDYEHARSWLMETCEFPLVAESILEIFRSVEVPTQKQDYCPWFKFGFYNAMIRPLENVLDSKGYMLQGLPEQVYFSYRSVIYKVPTESGQFFYKVCPKGSNEISLTQAVVRLYPEETADLIGVSEGVNAVLMSDMGATLSELCFFSTSLLPIPGYERPEKIANEIFMQWARMQQYSTIFLRDLKENGVPVHDEKWFEAGFEELFNYMTKNAVGKTNLEHIPSRENCRAFIARTFSLWRETRIPETIIHGDFHEDNICQPGGPGTKFVVINWDLVSIGMPFLDIMHSYERPLYEYTSFYLNQWKDYASFEDIMRLSQRATTLNSLVSAIVVYNSSFLDSGTRSMIVKENMNEFFEEVQLEFNEYQKKETPSPTGSSSLDEYQARGTCFSESNITQAQQTSQLEK